MIFNVYSLFRKRIHVVFLIMRSKNQGEDDDGRGGDEKFGESIEKEINFILVGGR